MTVEPYEITVAHEVLDDLRHRLEQTRWVDQPEGTGWELGADIAYLRRLARHWLESYDWSRTEGRLNSLPNFTAGVYGHRIHFVHQRSTDPSATPLLLVHGWPDSYLRFERILPLLTAPRRHGSDPAEAFHVVVPSLPGFGFSDRPAHLGVDHVRIGEILVQLMGELGYQRFMAHGGDWGSSVCAAAALRSPQQVAGLHLTEIPLWLIETAPRDTLDVSELTFRQEAARWARRDGGYALVQATSSQTIASALNDSPLGLAAWIVEKLRAWSDCDGEIESRFDLDTVIDWIMIYWVTQTAGSAARLYYEYAQSNADRARWASGRISSPTAFALFPKDLMRPPQIAAERWFDVWRWTELTAGGHFGAFEEPQALADDLRSFRRQLREVW